MDSKKKEPVVIKENNFIIENSNGIDGFKIKLSNLKKTEEDSKSNNQIRDFQSIYGHGQYYD